MIIGVGGGTWWWASRDPLKLPDSACWSLVDRSDLLPLAGDAGGTFAVRHRTEGQYDDGSRFTPGVRHQTCVVDGHQRVLLVLDVWGIDEDSFHREYELGFRMPSWAPEQQLSLGPDLKAWAGVNATRLAFRCDNLVARDKDVAAVEIAVEGGLRTADVKSASGQQARLDIALKVARQTVDRSLLCQNKVAFPDKPVAAALPF
ncbi:hypothetical protein ACIRVF_26735 [Kitasatospora sp. NPDC101157]|uniref:hypothetical protein n=1 Tax=Kitasatospora sp. NPDC101157 TaxID=3364098 RepID=UPI00380B6A8E